MVQRHVLAVWVFLAACGAPLPTGTNDAGGGNDGGAATGGGSGGGATGGGVQAGGGVASGGGVETGGGAATGGGASTGGGAATGGGVATGGGTSTTGGGQASGGGTATGGGTVGSGWEDPGTMTAGARLYTADGQAFTIDQVGAALSHTLGSATSGHVIFYVHGRACGGGGEPSKSLDGAMPELESNYKAKAIMFTWPGSSSGCPLGFPEPEARASGPAFAHFLHKFAFTLHSTPQLAGFTYTLIVHSLGGIVLEEALLKDTATLPTELFDTMMLQSCASAADKHATWLTKLRFSPFVYVSINDGDQVLTAAGVGRSVRLGKSVTGEPLASNAKYIDFSAAGVNHAYYLHSGQKGTNMRVFYDAVMKAKPYDFSTSAAVTKTDNRNGTTVYTFSGL